MLYQVILTEEELKLLHESLDAAIEYYEEYGENECSNKVKQLTQSIVFGTMKW